MITSTVFKIIRLIDFSFNTTSKPGKGSLLLSEPFASDHYFTRSVIILCDHNDETGTFGFVLNNYLDVELHTLNPRFPVIETKVSMGGPVDTESIFYIHSFGPKVNDSIHVGGDLYFGGDFDAIVALVEENPVNANKVRFFIGYAGWSPNQLHDEIEQNSWIVTNKYNLSDLLNTKERDLWKKIMVEQGGKFRMMSEFPINPNNN